MRQPRSIEKLATSAERTWPQTQGDSVGSRQARERLAQCLKPFEQELGLNRLLSPKTEEDVRAAFHRATMGDYYWDQIAQAHQPKVNSGVGPRGQTSKTKAG